MAAPYPFLPLARRCLAVVYASFACGCVETSGWVLKLAPDAEAVPEAGGDVSMTPDAAPDACSCPSSVVLGDASSTEQPGGDGGDAGTTWTDLCPEGQAVIGYKGWVQTGPLVNNNVPVTYVSTIQTICGQLVIADDASAKVVAITDENYLPERGPTNAMYHPMAWTQKCNMNEVITGFSGNAGDALDKIQFQCVPLSISKSPTGDVITKGSMTFGTTMPPAGGDGGLPFQEACRADQIAQGTAVLVSGRLEAFGLICATPTTIPADGGAPCCTALHQTPMAGATTGN